VYPAKFEYFAPTSLDEALELLGRFRQDSCPGCLRKFQAALV
jgi:hypothetical protein